MIVKHLLERQETWGRWEVGEPSLPFAAVFLSWSSWPLGGDEVGAPQGTFSKMQIICFPGERCICCSHFCTPWLWGLWGACRRRSPSQRCLSTSLALLGWPPSRTQPLFGCIWWGDGGTDWLFRGKHSATSAPCACGGGAWRVRMAVAPSWVVDVADEVLFHAGLIRFRGTGSHQTRGSQTQLAVHTEAGSLAERNAWASCHGTWETQVLTRRQLGGQGLGGSIHPGLGADCTIPWLSVSATFLAIWIFMCHIYTAILLFK